MRPIATTSDAAPRATPKSARSETVFGRPRREPLRNRVARNAGTRTPRSVAALPLLALELPGAAFLDHVRDAVLRAVVRLARDGEVGRVALFRDLQDLHVLRRHHLDHLEHLLRVGLVELLDHLGGDE